MGDFLDLPPETPPKTADVTPLHRSPGPIPGYPNLHPAPPIKPGQVLNPLGAGAPGALGGKRRRLHEAFIQDFHKIWEQEGILVIERVAKTDPSTFLKVAASLMPRDINLRSTVSVDATEFVSTFKSACEAVAALGNMSCRNAVARRRR